MKTVSLVEALASGKKFAFRIGSTDSFTGFHDWRTSTWTAFQILHAECQIIEEPKEIWVWRYDSGDLCDHNFPTEDECLKRSPHWGRPVKFREVCDE